MLIQASAPSQSSTTYLPLALQENPTNERIASNTTITNIDS